MSPHRIEVRLISLQCCPPASSEIAASRKCSRRTSTLAMQHAAAARTSMLRQQPPADGSDGIMQCCGAHDAGSTRSSRGGQHAAPTVVSGGVRNVRKMGVFDRPTIRGRGLSCLEEVSSPRAQRGPRAARPLPPPQKSNFSHPERGTGSHKYRTHTYGMKRGNSRSTLAGGMYDHQSTSIQPTRGFATLYRNRESTKPARPLQRSQSMHSMQTPRAHASHCHGAPDGLPKLTS